MGQIFPDLKIALNCWEWVVVLSSSAIAPSTGPRSASEVITGPGRVARLLQHHYSTSIGLTQHTFGT